jgi:Icc-related predicted phosphoesterase
MFESHPEKARSFLTNAIYLENSGVELEGLKFWGSPVQPEFNSWAFNVKRGAAIRRYWDKIPMDTDVIVTHGPPFGILDQSRSRHLGCEEFAKTVNKIVPRLNVFGHIHGGRGYFLGKNGTQFVNASVLNDLYMLVYEAQIIDLEI